MGANFGKYPVEYQPRVHGPYDPARFYGKPDTPLADVKLGEFGTWFGRRNKSLQGMTACISRGLHRWARTGIQASKHSFAPYAQAIFVCVLYAYIVRAPRHRLHARAVYH